MPEAAWFAHVESPENARTAWDIVVRPLPDACLPLCARYLIATAIDPLSLISLSTWKTVLAGFTTAARPIAGFASGYRDRGVCVAAAAGCDRPRSGRPPGAAVSPVLRVGRFCVCFAAERRLRQRLQKKRRPGCGAPGSQWQVSRQPGSRRWPALVSEFDP
ncbi:hypothetical protein C4K21_3451 [Pseudomonas chlororaphis subsp. aurantiaca]|nr:hypothetical protein C4K21_3451 [Pseudomonas chlororaphis subsp. aurantiaca]